MSEFMPTNIDIQALAREIAARITSDALLSAEDVAALLRCSTNYVRQEISVSPGFPAAIRLKAADGRRGHRRWRRSDIMDWVDSQAEQSSASLRKSARTRKVV